MRFGYQRSEKCAILVSAKVFWFHGGDYAPLNNEGIMSTNTAGYARLQTLISNLIEASNGIEQTIFKRWAQRRFGVITSGLECVCAEARVRVFFDEYASVLASELEALLPEGPLDEPAQTAIDYIEGLHTQTQRFSETVEPLYEVETDNNLAMAA